MDNSFNSCKQEWFEKYVAHIAEREKRERNLIDTIDSLENDLKKLVEELIKVNQEKEVIRLQLEIMASEKELHIEEHAIDANNWKKERKRLIESFEEEKKQLKKLYHQALHEAEKFKKLFEEVQIKKHTKEDNLKKKIELKAGEYSKILTEKEKVIRDLQIKVQDADKPKSKASRLNTSAKKKVSKKKHPSMKRLNSCAVLDALISPRSGAKGDSFEDISGIIINLGKEQEVLKEKVRNLEESANSRYLDLNISKHDDRSREIGRYLDSNSQKIKIEDL
ncbi:unnamed protein product [Blepharisma stoltei]|uniref:Uncharacterized protein n=1 Tax=Blepharisma stoltei TaxID=1481888 RepID=A0AAU9IGG0_9CILI|nr:unnamed protein product [Blepharisma stoltei]